MLERHAAPDANSAVRELLEQRLDQIENTIHEMSRELRDGQNRIERDMHERLSRIERQVIETNGRVTRLEAWKISVEARGDQRMSDKAWVQPIITGAVTVILAALAIAVFGIDRL